MSRVKLGNLTDIRSNDLLLLLLFFLYSLCIGMFITVGFSIGDSLFLSNVPQDKVNSLYAWGHVGIAAAAIAITWGYNSIIERFARIKSLIGMQLFLMISVFGFHQLLIADTLHAKDIGDLMRVYKKSC